MAISKDCFESVPDSGMRRRKSLQEVVVAAKVVHSKTGFRWYLIEFDREDRFFGIVAGRHAVVGEFTLSELQALGDEASIDPDFRPSSVGEVARRDKAVAALLPEDDLVGLD